MAFQVCARVLGVYKGSWCNVRVEIQKLVLHFSETVCPKRLSSIVLYTDSC